MLTALRELARRNSNGGMTQADAVDVCAWRLAIIGVDCDQVTFLRRCVAEGLGANLGPRLWEALAARRRSAQRS